MTSTAIRGRLGKNVGLLGRLIGAADVLVASPEPRQAEPGRMDPFGVDGGHLGLGIRGKSGTRVDRRLSSVVDDALPTGPRKG